MSDADIPALLPARIPLAIVYLIEVCFIFLICEKFTDMTRGGSEPSIAFVVSLISVGFFSNHGVLTRPLRDYVIATGIVSIACLYAVEIFIPFDVWFCLRLITLGICYVIVVGNTLLYLCKHLDE